jgi:hypothetical protein
LFFPQAYISLLYWVYLSIQRQNIWDKGSHQVSFTLNFYLVFTGTYQYDSKFPSNLCHIFGDISPFMSEINQFLAVMRNVWSAGRQTRVTKNFPSHGQGGFLCSICVLGIQKLTNRINIHLAMATSISQRIWANYKAGQI